MTKKRKLCLMLAVFFAVDLLALCFVLRADAVTYQRGSSGETVKEIQTRLKNWGYYSAGIDGVYGSRTEAAVKQFQRKNGLTADGKAGPATLAAMGISASTAARSGQGDLNLLARLISAEARGEPYTGQVAVGAVVLNRMKHPSFPNTTHFSLPLFF